MKYYLKLAIVLYFTGFILNCTYAQKVKDSTITIYFESNSYTIDTSQQRELIHFLSIAKSINQIKGYADSVGTREYNLALSQKRAEVITNIVKKASVELRQKPAYVGEDFLQEPDLEKNRKVEITGTISIIEESTSGNEVLSSFNLDNIYFVPDRAIITDESLPYVNELAKRLKEYKTESFEIIGHVNYQSKKDSSQLRDLYWLSERRAKTIYNILIEKGIPASRLLYKGVGNSQPLYPNPINDDQKRKNMRVEVVILKG